MNVRLTPSELRYGAEVGSLRRIRAIAKGRRHLYGKPEDDDHWESDIEGALAEMAVAKALDLYWADDPELDHAGDVGGLHVRHTTWASGGLILHDRDPDDGIFILVVGEQGEYRIAGWMRASDGKTPEWRANGQGKLREGGFLVPQHALAGITCLPL